MTDLMLSKLASLSWARSATLLPGEINRDEIRLVVCDTVILCESEDPHALLSQWQESA